MEYVSIQLLRHEYSVLFLIVFLECVGLPLPASVALLAVGALSATTPEHLPHLGFAMLVALAASLLGDVLLFLAGRKTGWWLLSLLCRLSANPESCILRSAESFYKRGSRTLLYSKFIPGLNALAAPLAGSMRMPMATFLRFDLAGASLYCGAWIGVGFLFSGFIAVITRGLTSAGHLVLALVSLAIGVYVGYYLYLSWKARRYKLIRRVAPEELDRRLRDADVDRPPLIADCRSHGYYEANARRIPGSVRLEPNNILNSLGHLPGDRDVYLYCSCIRESTSARVAWMLEERGHNVHVIEGGLNAWTDANLPTEPVPAEDVVLLPSFRT
jgi:membrane protein DedA with SNARE-associated domain/rhodanese-related sulfurtransferase